MARRPAKFPDYRCEAFAQVKVTELKLHEFEGLKHQLFRHEKEKPAELAVTEVALMRELMRLKEQTAFIASRREPPADKREIRKATTRLLSEIQNETDKGYWRDPYSDLWYLELKKQVLFEERKYRSSSDEDKRRNLCSAANNLDHHYPHYVCETVNEHREANNNVTAYLFLTYKLNTGWPNDPLWRAALQHQLYANRNYERAANIFGGELLERVRAQALEEMKRSFEQETGHQSFTPHELARLYKLPVEVKKDYNSHQLRFTPDGKVYACCAPDDRPGQPQVGTKNFYEITETENEVEFLHRIGKSLPECFQDYFNGEYNYVELIDGRRKRGDSEND